MPLQRKTPFNSKKVRPTPTKPDPEQADLDRAIEKALVPQPEKTKPEGIKPTHRLVPPTALSVNGEYMGIDTAGRPHLFRFEDGKFLAWDGSGTLRYMPKMVLVAI